jgi:CMP-2-keto-3-deoxyoctulosonic acid synthetase
LIIRAARAFGAAAQLTARAHASGTDRIAEVARVRGCSA